MASQGTAVVDTIEDYSKMKVVELKKLLKDRGLSVAGTKDELIERLKQANEAAEKKLLEETAEETTAGDTTAASIDEELENEIMNDENKVTSTSLAKPGDKRKLTENGSSESSQPPAKKLEVEEDKENSGQTGTESADTEDKEATDSPSKKIIKLSTITAEEKRELRAKKFGLTEEEKKEARAKRFGISAAVTAQVKTNSNKAVKSPLVKAPAAKVNKNTEQMKKRAERFGLLGNQKLTPEEEEKRKKRAERFGSNTAASQQPVVVAATTPASAPASAPASTPATPPVIPVLPTAITVEK